MSYTSDTGRVICPYCDGRNDLSEAIGARGESVDSWQCGTCDKTFRVRVHVSISVTAERDRSDL